MSTTVKEEKPERNHSPQLCEEHMAPRNLYCWEFLYLPFKRLILHSGRGLDLLGTKVL
jgi:hypothetical protein